MWTTKLSRPWATQSNTWSNSRDKGCCERTWLFPDINSTKIWISSKTSYLLYCPIIVYYEFMQVIFLKNLYFYLLGTTVYNIFFLLFKMVMLGGGGRICTETLKLYKSLKIQIEILIIKMFKFTRICVNNSLLALSMISRV